MAVQNEETKPQMNQKTSKKTTVWQWMFLFQKASQKLVKQATQEKQELCDEYYTALKQLKNIINQKDSD